MLSALNAAAAYMYLIYMIMCDEVLVAYTHQQHISHSYTLAKYADIFIRYTHTQSNRKRIRCRNCVPIRFGDSGGGDDDDDDDVIMLA